MRASKIVKVEEDDDIYGAGLDGWLIDAEMWSEWTTDKEDFEDDPDIEVEEVPKLSSPDDILDLFFVKSVTKV